MEQEKRKQPRFNSLNLMSFICYNESGEAVCQGMGRTLNVSNNGVELETHIPVDQYSGVSLTIEFEDELLDVEGRVIRSKKVGDSIYETGIAFVEINEKDQAIINSYIDLFKTYAEKRRTPRFFSMNLLAYEGLGEKGEVTLHGMGRTLDISETGLRFESHVPLDKYKKLLFSIGFKNDLVKIRGRLVHSEPCAGNRYEAGIHFLEMEDRAFQTLKKFIAAFHAQNDNAA